MPASHDGRKIWERRAGDAGAPVARYRRREPEKTLLHEVVRAEIETFASVSSRARRRDAANLRAQRASGSGDC